MSAQALDKFAEKIKAEFSVTLANFSTKKDEEILDLHAKIKSMQRGLETKFIKSTTATKD